MFVLLNITKFVGRMLPPFRRGPAMRAWLVSLFKPTETLWSEFLAFRASILDMLTTYPTSESLQTKLRSLYPTTGGYQVWVKTTHDDKPTQYDQFLGEHRPDAYDFFLSESTAQVDYFMMERDTATDYIVYVPTAYNVPGTLNSVVAFLNRYRPAGKHYQIIFQNI